MSALSKVQFWKFSTAGNTTLFVNKKGYILEALRIIGAEQAGYFKDGELEMAGGEMCVNACLALAALLAMEGCNESEVLIAGQRVRLQSQGSAPEWRCEAEFAPVCRPEERAEINIQHLSGISHALLPVDEFPTETEAFASARAIRQNLGLDSKAVGVIWWRELDGELEIQPLVAVPKAGTCNLEQACGSGSLALAMSLPEGTYKIRQPSGQYLQVAARPGKASIRGPVRLLAQGQTWA